MSLVKDDYVIHHFGEAEDHEGKRVLHPDLSRGSKIRGDEIRQTAKAFDLTSDYGADLNTRYLR